MKSIPFTELPDDIRKEFKYEPAKAEAYEKGRQEWEKKNAEEKAEAEKQKKIDDQRFEQNIQKMIHQEQLEAAEREQAALAKKNSPGEVNADTLSNYANQFAGGTLTDMDKSQLWNKSKFKQVESSGVVKDVRRMDDSNMTLMPGEYDVVLSHSQTNAWEVLVYSPNYPKSIGVSLVLYNYDTAKNLSKGQKIDFKGTLWRFNNNRIYLSPASILN